MYEGIPTKKKAPSEKSWAPKHKAVFGEESRMIHDSVFKDQKSEAEMAKEAKRIPGNGPAPIHEKVFGKEERIQAPVHEKVFGRERSVEKVVPGESVEEKIKETPSVEGQRERAERARALKEFFSMRSRLESLEPARRRLDVLQQERKLDLSTFRNVFTDVLRMYDDLYLPLAKSFFKDVNDARIETVEELREALKDKEEVRKRYETYLADSMRKEPEKKAA